MLFDFHQWQNGRQPGSVHATYLVAGTRDEPEAMEDDAVNMSSQMSYGQAASPSLTVALVAESQLKG